MPDHTGSISLNQSDPGLGEYVTFTTDIDGNVKNPRVEVQCYQDDDLVFGMAGAPDYEFLLGGGGSVWKDKGGPAHCVANLFFWGKEKGQQTYEKIASTEFDAHG